MLPQASEMTAITPIAIVQRRSSCGNTVDEHAERDDERGDLRRRRHEGGDRRRRALVGIGRPHVERRRRRLEGETGDDHREPDHEHRVVPVAERGDAVEAQLPGLAVDERGSEEQRRRADRADDQVLEAGLERTDQVDVDGESGRRARSRTTRARGRASSGSTRRRRRSFPRPQQRAGRTPRRRARRATAPRRRAGR